MVRLGDLAASSRNALVGGPFGSNLTTSDFVAAGVPVIQGKNMGRRWLDGDFVHVSPEKAELLRANIARPGDVIFTQRGTLGQVSLAPPVGPAAYVVSQSQMKLTVDRAIADPEFVYYAFTSPGQREYMFTHAIRTGVPHTNLGILREATLLLPPLVEQRAIAEILGALDDKIESNGRMLTALSMLTRTLYESALHHGVTETTVGKIAEFHNNRRVPLSAMERAEMPGDYPYFGATGIFDRVGRYLFDRIIALVGEDGSVVNEDGSPVVQYVWGKSWVNNHAHVLTGVDVTTELLVIALGHSDVRPFVTGAVQAKLSMRNLKSVPILLPPGVTQQSLERTLTELFERRRAAEDESRTLAAFRDSLLPELLSGQLRVPEAREKVEAVV